MVHAVRQKERWLLMHVFVSRLVFLVSVVTALILLSAGVSSAADGDSHDILLLRDGTRIEGAILNVTEDYVVIQTGSESEDCSLVDRAEVTMIIYADGEVVELPRRTDGDACLVDSDGGRGQICVVFDRENLGKNLGSLFWFTTGCRCRRYAASCCSYRYNRLHPCNHELHDSGSRNRSLFDGYQRRVSGETTVRAGVHRMRILVYKTIKRSPHARVWSGSVCSDLAKWPLSPTFEYDGRGFNAAFGYDSETFAVEDYELFVDMLELDVTVKSGMATVIEIKCDVETYEILVTDMYLWQE